MINQEQFNDLKNTHLKWRLRHKILIELIPLNS